MSRRIDLRSDTVTLPSAEMRRAMAQAEVGDDVFGEDPSVNRLERRIADLLGKEQALFVPSGTMSNQIGLHVHTRPGDEMICEANAHVYYYEAGGPAVLSGLTCKLLTGRRGILDVGDFADTLNPDDVHKPPTRLVALENTHNRGGGSIYPIANIEGIAAWARGHGLALHLDGARLFNAVVATGIAADRWASQFDTVSVCFSKGLGAPVGSALAGTQAHIRAARRTRKLLGGGMRQAGILAAACLHALDHNITRLAEDHANAKFLAGVFANAGLGIDPAEVETNIVWVKVDPRFGSAHDLVERFAAEGILMLSLGKDALRAVTNLNVTRADIDHAATVIPRLLGVRR